MTSSVAKDIVLLGAGASAAEGAPIQGNLFKEYFLLKPGDPERLIRLQGFFNSFFGINVSNNDPSSIAFPTFEEVLGVLDLALVRGEGFRNNQDVQEFRRDMIFLIANILDVKLRGDVQHHKILVDRLKRENGLLKTAFISLNYEILIDNVLTDLYDEIDLDYGIDFANNEWRRPRQDKSVRLCKLHGSLNWLYCPTCVALRLTPKEKAISKMALRPKNCWSCSANVEPIIVPPTFFKVMSNIFLAQIWRNADMLLHKAERIFFCGYSFPDADIHIKYLLKRMELYKSRPPRIFVINNHKDKQDQEKKNEKERYERFFKKSSRVEYTELSFQEFCEKGI